MSTIIVLHTEILIVGRGTTNATIIVAIMVVAEEVKVVMALAENN